MRDETEEPGPHLDARNKTERARFSRLLLVDDNESLLITLTAILQGEGFAVTGCSTAVAARQHIQQGDFGVAVVDLRLPDMHGTQLLKEFNHLGSKVRVIIHTAYGAFESAKDAVNLGAFAYIEKAGDPGDLVRQVHRAYRSHFERYADDLESSVAERTAELSESEKRLRLVFENAPVYLWHEDLSGVKQRVDRLKQKGVEDFHEYFDNHPDAVADCARAVKIMDVNLAALKLHRAGSKSELLESLANVLTVESIDVFREELIALANGERKFESDAVVLTLDGERKDVMLRMFVDPGVPDWASAYVALTDITDRKRAEESLRRLALSLATTEQNIRRNVADVLHDDVQQLLTAALWKAQSLAAENPTDVNKSATALSDLISQALTATRTLTSQMNPPILREGRLDLSFEWLADWMEANHGLTISLQCEYVPQLAMEVTEFLFTSTRELLFNVVKHAGVSRADVRMHRSGSDLEISVSDAGQGFAPGEELHPKISGGLGLVALRERLQALGGRLEIESTPHQGTKVRMIVPGDHSNQ